MAQEPERGAFGVRAGTGCAAGTVRECCGGVAPLSQGVLTGREVENGSAASAQDSMVLVCSPDAQSDTHRAVLC
jgi:hypothetical protein